MERVGRVAAVAARVGERADDVEHLDDGAGPAVGDDERQRVRLGRADVQGVDRLPVEGGEQLRVLVEACLPGAPVVAVRPVVGDLTEVGDGHAALPADVGQVGPPGALDALAEVVERGVGHVDAELLEGHVRSSRATRRAASSHRLTGARRGSRG